MLSLPLVPLATTSLPQAVYAALRESIVTMIDAPGTLFTETAIAERYGVARPTAKAALERLVSEGLLTRRAHHAAQVPLLSADDIRDLYANRAILEAAALRNLVAEAIAPQAAIAIHRQLREHAHSDDRTALARADLDFHRALVVAQPSARLAKMHGLLMGEIELCTGQVQSRQLMRPIAVVDQHQAILDAVASGDPAVCERLIREHIFAARDSLLRRYEQDHSSATPIITTPK